MLSYEDNSILWAGLCLYRMRILACGVNFERIQKRKKEEDILL